MNADETVANAINVLSGRTKEETFSLHCSKLLDDKFICKFEYSSNIERKRIVKTIKSLKSLFRNFSGKSSSSNIEIREIKSELGKDKGLMTISIDNVYSSFFGKENLDYIKDTIFYKLYV